MNMHLQMMPFWSRRTRPQRSQLATLNPAANIPGPRQVALLIFELAAWLSIIPANSMF
jgi:hypothetical protein